MAILVVLIGGLAGVTTASLRLGRNILETGQENAVRDGFERLLRENLNEIPQDCPLLVQEGGVGGTQSVILGKASGMFPVSGLPLVTESVALETRRDRSGALALWLIYYAGDLTQAIQDNAVDTELLVQIPFKDGLERLQWKVYDAVNDEWLEEWEERGRRPHYLELIYRFAGDIADHRMVFWLPRLQTNTGGNQGGAGAGQPTGPGGPNAPGQGGINVPGGQVPMPGGGGGNRNGGGRGNGGGNRGPGGGTRR